MDNFIKNVKKNVKRMCGTYYMNNCSGCPAVSLCNRFPSKSISINNVQRFVDTAKEWAQSHPEKTKREWFTETTGYSLAPSRMCMSYADGNCRLLNENQLPCVDCPVWDEPRPYKEEEDE